MTLPPPGQPRRWPMHRERHVTECLAAARRDAFDATYQAFDPWVLGRIAWRVGHHAGRLFAQRERAREEYEAKGGER